MRLLTLFAALVLATTARAETPRVLTDISPVGSIVDAVMGELGSPDQLLARDADPHYVQLRPSQARMLAGADLLVWVGPALTPGLEGIAASTDAHQVQLVESHGTEHNHDHDNGHDNGHDHGHDHGHDDHSDHGTGHSDAHGWLNPTVGAKWADQIAEALSKLDPANADTYRANAQALASELATISLDIEIRAATLSNRNIVVLHDAYDAFADRFGITVSGALKASDANAPSAKRMTEIDAILESGHVKCWFAEVGQDAKLLNAVTENTLTSGGVLDPVGQTLEPGPDLYPNLIRQMADQILGCLEES